MHLNHKHITVLGGGPAGLAVGYYAIKSGFPFTIYEASDHIGGNCITFKHGEFLFDSGAHRLHDRDSEVTEELKNLIGEDLRRINVPSQIYHNGKFIDFPLSPLNLMKNLGVISFIKAGGDLIRAKLTSSKLDGSFKRLATLTYGKSIAERFLLNYSEKLWGLPSSDISSNIAGARLKGLNLKTFLIEAILGQKKKTEHLEGSSFYYPKMGIGVITEKLGEFCGEENILKSSKITKLIHNEKCILAAEINNDRIIELQEVVNTLPLNFLLQIMEPKPPNEILSQAKNLSYRNMILVAFLLNRETVTKVATVYFPDAAIPFTRIYEPKNRSMYMVPLGKTSLVAEIPCQRGDRVWGMEDKNLVQLVRSCLMQMGWIKEIEIIDALVYRLAYAYPVLGIDYEEQIHKIITYLKGFNNLNLTGRNAQFTYSWVHDMMRSGKEIIQEYGQTL